MRTDCGSQRDECSYSPALLVASRSSQTVKPSVERRISHGIPVSASATDVITRGCLCWGLRCGGKGVQPHGPAHCGPSVSSGALPLQAIPAVSEHYGQLQGVPALHAASRLTALGGSLRIAPDTRCEILRTASDRDCKRAFRDATQCANQCSMRSAGLEVGIKAADNDGYCMGP
jgi:hypothetical protein